MDTRLGISRTKLNDIYHIQKRHAKNRGIEWLFTYESWIKVWEDSGKFHLRGCRVGQYVMARKGPDIGPYSPDNVEIKTCSENNKDRALSRRKP